MYYVFNVFSAVPNRFKYSQNACFRDIVFIFPLKLQIVASSIRLHTTLFPKSSLQFQNFTSDSVRMYHFTVPVFKNIRLGWPTTSCPPPSFNTNSQIRSWLHCDYMLVVVLYELICMTVACTNVILQRLVCLHGQQCIF